MPVVDRQFDIVMRVSGEQGQRPLIATQSLSSFVFSGETFTQSTALPVGEYVMGEPFVLTTGATTITAMGIPSSGAGNGAHADPYLPGNPVAAAQGFDPMLAINNNKATPYSGDIDPTAAAAAYPIASGAETTIVKSLHLAGATVNSYQTIEEYLPVTYIPAAKAPRSGAYRPGMSALNKISRASRHDLDFGCCRSLDLSGLGYPSYATLIARWRSAIPYFGQELGECLRTFNVFNHISSGSYSSDVAPMLIGDSGALLHSAATSEVERIAISDFIVQMACDIAGAVEQGWDGVCGQGQGEVFQQCLYWAAALTDKAYFLDATASIRSNMDQAFWCKPENIGLYTDWPTGNEGGFHQYIVPYSDNDLGKGCFRNGFDGVNETSDETGAQLNRTYMEVSGRARTDCLIPLMLIQPNRNMPSGYDMLASGPHAASRTAILDLVDREIKIYPTSGAGISSRARAFYNRFRSLITPAKLAHVPDVITYSNFTAGNNLVSWDYSALVTAQGFSSTAITAQHVYLSQDNIQFKKFASVAAVASQAVPGGIPIWCSLALENAQGEGRRSYTFKNVSEDAIERGYLTPTGAASGAVTCLDIPVIMQREYLLNTGGVPWYIAPSGSVAVGSLLYFGTGWWTGAISGAATVQLQREATLNAGDWGDIAGASPYTVVSGDSGKRLRTVVTRNGVSATSSPVTAA